MLVRENVSWLWHGSLEFLRYFVFTFSVILPVGITVADEVGVPAKINGISMRPTFNPVPSGRRKKWWDCDIVWVSCWNIQNRCHALKPGDVVAVRSPLDTESLIKRTVATPGERIRTLKYCEDTVIVPPSHYWIEGDNCSIRNEDSNIFGPVSEGLVFGLVTHILWPPHRWQKVCRKLTPEQTSRRNETAL